MPGANDAALEERESRLDTVRGDVSVDVFSQPMIDRFVTFATDSRLLHRTLVVRPFIRHHDFHIAAQLPFDVLRQCPSLRIFGVEEPEFPIVPFEAARTCFRRFAWPVLCRGTCRLRMSHPSR